jgi:putative transposase
MHAHRSHTEFFYHFIWSTGNRERIISTAWEIRLFDFLAAKCIELRSPSLSINGIEDHVHVLLRGNTILSPAKIAHDLKGASSFMINKEGSCRLHFTWQDGYGGYSVSAHDVKVVSRYIQNQKAHHTRKSIRLDLELNDSDLTPESE